MRLSKYTIGIQLSLNYLPNQILYVPTSNDLKLVDYMFYCLNDSFRWIALHTDTKENGE